MEDEEEVLSVSDTSDSSEEYTVDHEEEEEDLEDANNEDEPSVPSDQDRKSKNVDALLRYYLDFVNQRISAPNCS
jgi:DNA repair and recombination RAD54-like protein